MHVRRPSPELLLVVADVVAVAVLAAVVLGSTGPAPAPAAARSASAAVLTGSGRPVPVLFVVREDAFSDALAAGPAAGSLGGPVLRLAGSALSPQARDELTRRHPARIVVLGGTGAVSAAVADELEDFTSGTVSRLAGEDRYATAAEVATAFFRAPVPRVLVADGSGTGQVLTAGSAAAGEDSPVLLVTSTGVPESTAAALRVLQPRRIAVLGSAAQVSDEVLRALQAFTTTGRVSRLSGESSPAGAPAGGTAED